jgi:hypothetical protein
MTNKTRLLMAISFSILANAAFSGELPDERLHINPAVGRRILFELQPEVEPQPRVELQSEVVPQPEAAATPTSITGGPDLLPGVLGLQTPPQIIRVLIQPAATESQDGPSGAIPAWHFRPISSPAGSRGSFASPNSTPSREPKKKDCKRQRTDE